MSEATKARGRLAAIVRHHGSDSFYAKEARRDLLAANLERELTKALGADLPLTLDQVRRLRHILEAGQVYR